jgi:ribosome maturation factor RimP
MTRDLFLDIETWLEGLGFELVTFSRSGGRGRGALRLRIDRLGTEPEGPGVTIDDCARVSRGLREWLEGRADVPADYELEVSSPGAERPLVRPRDYERFAGREARLKGYGPLAERSRSLQGKILGVVPSVDVAPRVAIEVAGERLEVPLDAIASAHLVYDWEEDL